MEGFAEYLAQIENLQHCTRMEAVRGWVCEALPMLAPRIQWNQSMFTDGQLICLCCRPSSFKPIAIYSNLIN